MNGGISKLDKNAVRRAFERSAPDYDSVATLQRKIGARLLARLSQAQHQQRLTNSRVILDLGCGTGWAIPALHCYAPQAQIIAVDFAYSMLLQARQRTAGIACLCGDVEQLPLRDGVVDLIYSNATLQWCQDLKATFLALRQTLAPKGLLAFTTFGPATLQELRAAWTQADNYAHTSAFSSLSDLQTWLKNAGFVDFTLEQELLTLNYANVRALMNDLKSLGARNAAQERARGLTGKGRLATMTQAYESLRAADGLPATYEIFYGLAWNP